ncbi:hypothetical protein SELMODRAFT_167667 [Selaginella moellendorffii]|uniref:Fungal lipase-like domain-containing protein n=1 Tax=Selaginella moellendorffii TaxID=88036 RepID=D8R3I7_SELML|nr:uncharacterized protein LOC9634305 [Selaginella moellendorffii]EFJ33287.1 hypothetical protein SELMODRAFT_167667 [Selaginella moellendorffii]|eukprot:XP_002965867.1 uncharacterized protein LOC9634305 [Selaginella moellendorffii]
MATATLATAAGAAALYYYSRWGIPWGRRGVDEFGELDEGGESSRSSSSSSLRMPRLVRAPSTWLEALATIMETLRFTYSETLGKWPIGDLAFGINYLLRRQGHLHVASVFAGDGCQLTGLEVVNTLKELLRLLLICLHFSKKPFPLFLEETGFSKDQVILQEPKAALLKPAFCVLRDDETESILLVIRGTHSIKDTLTAVTGAVVPFHLTVLHNGGVESLVLGYAHCGMVAAARWIAQLATPHLLEALNKSPGYRIKIVGHSLGGGTAALLTYILREKKEFSSANCVSFAPAACMTWELAESGLPFVTSVVNGSDLVPTFSAASVDDLRAEVTSSAWVSDFKEQIERTRILRTVYRSATAVSSRLPSMARMRTGVASAGAIWKPVSSSTQVVMKQAQNVAMAVVRTRPSLGLTGLSGWACIGPRRRANTVTSTVTSIKESEGGMEEAPKADSLPCSSTFTEVEETKWSVETQEETKWSVETQEDTKWSVETQEEMEIEAEFPGSSSQEAADHVSIGEEYLWQELEEELQRQKEEDRLGREEEERAAKEITKEEEDVMASATEMGRDIVLPSEEQGCGRERNRFYPPGRVIHMVSPLPEDSGSDGGEQEFKARVGLFETNRRLYGKVRLSRTMVNDHYMPIYRKTMEQLILELESQK